MSKLSLIRSKITGLLIVLVLVNLMAPYAISADVQNKSDAHANITMVKDGKLTVCKLDKSHYEVVKRQKMVVTAYTSIPELTDDTPNITASNKEVEYGMVATNIFKFGTKIRIPDVYGDQVFVVEDRMNRRYDERPHLDVYLPTYKEAKNFGVKITTIEKLES